MKLVMVLVLVLVVVSAGCISTADPGFGKVLNHTRSIVEDARKFRIDDPAAP